MTIVVLSWLFIGLIVYVYVGYPVLMAVWGHFLDRKLRLDATPPTVTIIVAAYNEEGVIAEKIENTLKLEYPRDHLQILVVADGSSDRTELISRTYGAEGVAVLADPVRAGKSAAINHGAGVANGDILVLSDANANYRPDAIEKLVRNFGDPTVGVASGRKTVISGAGEFAQAEGSYWKYESFIKSSETRSGSTAGVVGEIIAIRRELFERIPQNIINDDFFLALTAMRKGYRVIYEREAVSWELPSNSMADDALRRRRITAGRYQQLFMLGLWGKVGASNLFRIVSHKFLRLLLPFFMLGALVLNATAVMISSAPTPLVLTLLAQIICYLAAFAGFVLQRLGRKAPILSAAYYLVSANVASAAGLARYVLGRESVLWEKASRT